MKATATTAETSRLSRGNRRARRPGRAFEYCSRHVTTARVYQLRPARGKHLARVAVGQARDRREQSGAVVRGRGASSVATVHPIERLRYVARAGWAPPAVLAAEAAWALGDLALHEEPAVLPACRRLLDRHPGCGPLWWVAARILTAGDAVEEAERCADALESDPTADLLREDLAGERRAVRHGGVGDVASADVVVVEVDAIGPGGMVLDADDIGLIEAARAVGRARCGSEAGVGRVMPPRLWDALVRRLEAAPSPPVGLGRRPRRDRPGGGADRRAGRAPSPSPCTDCPEPGELLARW